MRGKRRRLWAARDSGKTWAGEGGLDVAKLSARLTGACSRPTSSTRWSVGPPTGVHGPRRRPHAPGRGVGGLRDAFSSLRRRVRGPRRRPGCHVLHTSLTGAREFGRPGSDPTLLFEASTDLRDELGALGGACGMTSRRPRSSPGRRGSSRRW